MRILCVTNMYPGPHDPDYGAFVARMCTALAGRGHEVEVAAIDTRSSGAIATPRKYLGLLASTLKRAEWADVLYAHYLVPTGVIAATGGAVARRPVVVTVHGGDVTLLGQPGGRALGKLALRRSAETIVVSRALAGELSNAVSDPGRISVINMGVDLERFVIRSQEGARAELGLRSGPLVVAVGGLTDRKNPLALLQALVRLRQRLPDARATFIGDGPLRPTVEHAVDRLGLAGAVHLTGAVPHDVVPTWMAASDVLALVSKREPLGVVALEALASGRPVVGTRVGGTSEVVPRTGPGRIVDPHDPAEIATALEGIITRSPSPAECRAAAAPYAVARQAGVIEDVLRSALAEPVDQGQG